MIIKRDRLLNELKESIGNRLIKVVTGLRRVGKSFLLFNLFYDYLKSINIKDENIIRIKLDDPDYMELRNPIKLNEYIKKNIINTFKTTYILIDEIQECIPVINPAFLDKNGCLIEGVDKNNCYYYFYDVLNGLLNKENLEIFVTGSNSHLLSTDIPTIFRGRSYCINVYPLSFKEIYEVYNNKTIENIWNDYITYGGLPALYNQSNNDFKEKYLTDLFQTTYYKDIIERYKLNQDTKISDVTNIIASNIGCGINAYNIEKTFKSNHSTNITDNTIKLYLLYLENSLLIKEAKRYNVKGRKYIGTLSKYYFLDTGLRNACLNFRQVENTHLLENVVYIELLRLGYNVDVGTVETWGKDPLTGKNIRICYEVDFVVNKGSKKYYIQVTNTISSEEKLLQEENSLLRIPDNFKKIIIIKDYDGARYNENGILFISLYDFLLNDAIID